MPVPPPPPPLPPPTSHPSAPSDASLDSDDAKSFPTASISPSRVPPPLPQPPSSPADTSLSRASDIPDDDGNVSPEHLTDDEHEQVSDSDDDNDSAESMQSASETYYEDIDDLTELTRDDPATWKDGLISRSDILPTYDSSGEDSPVDMHDNLEGPFSESGHGTPLRGIVELKPLHISTARDELSFPDGQDISDPIQRASMASPGQVDIEDMDDVDAALDEDEIEEVMGVHERASQTSIRRESFQSSKVSVSSDISPVHRQRPVQPKVEILPEEDEVEQLSPSEGQLDRADIDNSRETNARHRRNYSDWCDIADDELSLEELQIEADAVTAALEEISPASKPPLMREPALKPVCSEKPQLEKRMREVAAELANVQMVTAGWAADAEGSIGCGDEKRDDRLLRDEVGRLRITLNHLTRLTLERAYEVRDAVDAHR